jgi:DNA recombination protein RmuC
MVIRLPGRKEIIVDAKTPLDAYLSAIETTDPESASEHMRRHAQNVRQRVRELAAKSYWEQFSDSPDFVVLFVPGEQFLSAAFDNDPMLLEDALIQRVILATPSSLVALLRAIAFGWQQEHLAENAARVSELGSELHRRIATFTEHLIKLGRQLTASVESYNRAVGSLEHQVLPSARRFADLGVPTAKPLETLQPLAIALRNVNPAIVTGEDLDSDSVPQTQQ